MEITSFEWTRKIGKEIFSIYILINVYLKPTMLRLQLHATGWLKLIYTMLVLIGVPLPSGRGQTSREGLKNSQRSIFKRSQSHCAIGYQ